METDCEGTWVYAGQRQDGEHTVIRHRCTGCDEERFYTLSPSGATLIPFPDPTTRICP